MVVVNGDTLVDEVNEPVLQVYVDAPEAVRTTEFPEQRLAFKALTVGFAFTATVEVMLALHPPLFPVTVYTVSESGETETEAVRAPVLQVYEVAPLAVSTALLPAHTAALFTLRVGAVPTLTVAVLTLVQEPVVPVTV